MIFSSRSLCKGERTALLTPLPPGGDGVTMVPWVKLYSLRQTGNLCGWKVKSKSESQEKAARMEHFKLLKEVMVSLCEVGGVGIIKYEILVEQA